MVTVKLPLGEQTGLFILSPAVSWYPSTKILFYFVFLRISISEKNKQHSSEQNNSAKRISTTS